LEEGQEGLSKSKVASPYFFFPEESF
jgi:hypothetical protein